MTDDPTLKVRQDLRALEDLAASIEDQALHKGNDPLMPGGEAMVALGPDAVPDEWAEQIAAAELRHYASCPRTNHRGNKATGVPACIIKGAEHVADEDDEHVPVLQTLLFWSEAWRMEHGYPMPKRPTISSEANFIRWALEWAWDHELHWDDFAQDIRQARRALEDTLLAGRRVKRMRVLCDNADCERRPRLIMVYGDGPDLDFYKCPACKWRYDQKGYDRAYARQLRSGSAEKFVRLSDALDMLRGQGRSENTVRKWVADDKVTRKRDEATGHTLVWWPDLWRLHLSTTSRRRAVA